MTSIELHPLKRCIDVQNCQMSLPDQLTAAQYHGHDKRTKWREERDEPLSKRKQHDRPLLEQPFKSLRREETDVDVGLGLEIDVGGRVAERRKVTGDPARLDCIEMR